MTLNMITVIYEVYADIFHMKAHLSLLFYSQCSISTQLFRHYYMPSFNKNNTYELNDGYSLVLAEDIIDHLKLELYQNQILSYDVLLNDNQCLTMTNSFCTTKKELYDLLVHLLITIKSGIHVKDSKYLEISFPIYFGHDKTLSKLWSFKLEFQRSLADDEKRIDDISLDPLDWTDIRSLGHRIVDDMIDYLRDLRLRPAWRPMPLAVRNAIAQTNIPLKGQSPLEVYEEVRSLVLPYPVGNLHPHYWGYVQGTGSSIGAFAELITGTMNTMSWGGHQGSIYIERQILSWLKVLMDFPNDDTSSGVLVSGTSVATIIAMAVARKKFSNRTMKVYCSKEAHNCLIRAVDLLNIGRENLILISTNTKRQIDLKVGYYLGKKTRENRIKIKYSNHFRLWKQFLILMHVVLLLVVQVQLVQVL